MNGDVFIVTIGVAWIRINPETDEYIPVPQKSQRFGMRLSSLSENISNIKSVFELIYDIKPNAKIVLTVLPAPMVRGIQNIGEPPFVSDCLSKSVMRLTAHEICAEFDDRILYWPSFEMVRWLGGHVPPVFGQSDAHARQPNDELADIIAKSPISKFSI